jgi:hypothetical protein
MKVILMRLETSTEDGTFGAVYVNGKLTCFTLEPPMNGNKPNTSCIPAGTYDCVKDNTGRHKWFKVLNVPNRENIEWHVGNTWDEDPDETDTEGCILPGSSVGKVKGKRGVQASGIAMRYLVAAMGNPDKFELTIINNIVV